MSSEGLRLNIYTPERRLVESLQVAEITLPGSEGQIQVLPEHAPMLGTLETGLFSYLTSKKETVFGVISSGFFEVRENVIQVVAETLELKEEIDLERAKRAQQKAEEALKSDSLDDTQLKKYRLKLMRSLVRQNLTSN